MASKAEHKRKSDTSPMGFCRRSLTGGNIWDSLADLLKIMKLRGVDADDIKEVQEIVQHLFTNVVKPARSNRDSQQAKTHVDHMLFQLVDDMHSMWDAVSFLVRVLAKADTPSEMQTMCTVRGRQGVCQGLSKDATGSMWWQVLSVQRRETNDESKTTAATGWHDDHQCRSEVCWQIRRQARQRHYYDDGESWRSNCFQCGVNMVVAHIGANGLSLETDRWGGAREESRGFRQQSKGT